MTRCARCGGWKDEWIHDPAPSKERRESTAYHPFDPAIPASRVRELRKEFEANVEPANGEWCCDSCRQRFYTLKMVREKIDSLLRDAGVEP